METLINTGVALVVTETVKELVKNSIATYIKPKLEKAYRNTELENDLIKIEEYIKDYLERSYKSAEIMNTIVFKNQQKTIDDLYIPLTVVKSTPIHKKQSVKIYINKYKDELLNEYKKVLLVDSARMGKSTILKYLYLSTIRENKGIPVLIELRKLDKGVPIIEFILNEMNGIRRYFEKEHIYRLIEGGDFIFFFDGYDEITQESKKEITENLQRFISRASNNLFIISSRDENELNCFGDFQRFDIKALTKEEAYKLINKYDNYGEVSKILINKLENEENLKITQEFLENPLMVSLLYKAFEYKKTIPYKKHIFYRQVYDALFEEHDLSKSGAYKRKKESDLDIEDFHCILRTIGFITLTKGVTYSKEEFVKIVKQAKEKNKGIEFNENKYIKDLIYSVPIFVKEGTEYKWAHKSFQEYFAATYIYNDCKSNYDIILEKMIQKDNIRKYYNVLDFYYDIDYKGFKKIILYPILNDYIDYFKNSYIQEEYLNYDSNDLNIRKSILFNFSEIKAKKLDEEDMKEFKNHNITQLGKKIIDDFDRAAVMGNKRICMFLREKNIYTILNLLNNKKSNIISLIKNGGSEELEYTEGIAKEIDYEIYSLDDSIENPLNKKNIFPLVNNFLIDSATSFRSDSIIFLDYDVCINLKKEIEDEISLEKIDIDFL